MLPLMSALQGLQVRTTGTGQVHQKKEACETPFTYIVNPLPSSCRKAFLLFRPPFPFFFSSTLVASHYSRLRRHFKYACLPVPSFDSPPDISRYLFVMMPFPLPSLLFPFLSSCFFPRLSLSKLAAGLA